MDANSGGPEKFEDADESLSFGVLVHTVMPSELTDQISRNIAVDVVFKFFPLK